MTERLRATMALMLPLAIVTSLVFWQWFFQPLAANLEGAFGADSLTFDGRHRNFTIIGH
jgi:hypothetical protein